MKWTLMNVDQFLEDNWEKITYKCKLLPFCILKERSSEIYNWFQWIRKLWLKDFLVRNKIEQWKMVDYKRNEEFIKIFIDNNLDKICKWGFLITTTEIRLNFPELYSLYQFVNSPRCKIYKNFSEVCELYWLKRNVRDTPIDWTKKENVDKFVSDNLDKIVKDWKIIISTDYRKVHKMLWMVQSLNNWKNKYYKSWRQARQELWLPVAKKGKRIKK